MYIPGEGGRSGEAMAIALLSTYGMASGYAVPQWGTSGPDAAPRARREKPAIDGDEEHVGLGEIFDGALRIAIALTCVLGTLAVSLYALSVILR